MKSSYSCSVMMMMMESWSRAVVVFSFRSRSVVDLTSSVVDLSSSVVDAVASSKRSSNAFAISAAGIRGCTGVYRSDSLDKLMQEERAHFRVGAIWRGKRGPFLSF